MSEDESILTPEGVTVTKHLITFIDGEDEVVMIHLPVGTRAPLIKVCWFEGEQAADWFDLRGLGQEYVLKSGFYTFRYKTEDPRRTAATEVGCPFVFHSLTDAISFGGERRKAYGQSYSDSMGIFRHEEYPTNLEDLSTGVLVKQF
jgi:hypothetical protein